MRYFVEWAGKTRLVEVVTDKAGTRVLVDGVPHRAEIEPVEGTGLFSLLLDDRSTSFAARFEDGVADLQLHDREVRVPVEDERTREAHRATAGAKKASGQGVVKAVMPGVVKDVRVVAGTVVTLHQPLLVLEAMKMENEIRADRAGTVKTVHVVAGQAVEKGATLVTIAD